MEEELAPHNKAIRRALEPGCRMWSPILPVERNENPEYVKAAKNGESVIPNGVRGDTTTPAE